MKSNPPAPCTRREALGKLAGLLAVGMWPGALRAAMPADAKEFTFVAANDFHHEDAACTPWFTRLFKQMGAHPGAAFCLGLGDLANQGKKESIEAIMRLSAEAHLPFHPVAGNHDNDLTESTKVYAEILPGRLNYTFVHGGWQFVGLDTTDGKKYDGTRVQSATLAWLDREVPRLDARRPTVLFTHFPLASSTKYCPLNAEDVLRRLVDVNLRMVFSGHFHGRTQARRGACELVTNACCSRVRGNHDGTKDKGYWLCRAQPDGTVTHEFQTFAG